MIEDGVRKISVAEAMPTNRFDDFKMNNRVARKTEAARVIADI